jgi:hypothetical protein
LLNDGGLFQSLAIHQILEYRLSLLEREEPWQLPLI